MVTSSGSLLRDNMHVLYEMNLYTLTKSEEEHDLAQQFNILKKKKGVNSRVPCL